MLEASYMKHIAYKYKDCVGGTNMREVSDKYSAVQLSHRLNYHTIPS